MPSLDSLPDPPILREMGKCPKLCWKMWRCPNLASRCDQTAQHRETGK